MNAFFGTDLDKILRAQGIDTLILMGHATSGVILSPVRYAADARLQVDSNRTQLTPETWPAPPRDAWCGVSM